MLEKVLVAEDHQNSSKAVTKIIEELAIPLCHYVYYCDDAFTRLKNELNSGRPYDLLVTDISFIEDHRTQQLKSGVELIIAAREIQPQLKVIIFSGEDRTAKIQSYFKDLKVDGYVQKGRTDAIELEKAVEAVAKGQVYMPPGIREKINPSHSHQFTNYDVTVLSLLAEGKKLQEIPDLLVKLNISPSGKSSMEKRLNHIKTVLDFNKNEQLIAFCKDMGII
ncbi:MAG: response regulator [Pedobacter sp.]|uniref:response regulator n=1 Tax=Pedobacter sp. TaxID=1411316 RepID=UPI00280A0B04|nr:response regulator [Pedobacter sp.]MDQ8003375.1 response regulator [Pedobacter sp.]